MISEEYENKDLIDSLQGYPCAQEILRQLPNVNSVVMKLIDSIFGINKDVNLTFKADPSLTKDSLINGYTPNPSSSGSGWLEQTIFFNAWVIQNSTREYIAETMIHEGIHAVLNYYRDRYLRWTINHNDPDGIDSNTFKQMFPIYWDYKRQLTSLELAEHNEMAENLISKFKNFLTTFNPAISDTMASSLAWKGLQGTMVWKLKGADTLNILNLQRIARRDLDTTSYSNYNTTKCE